MADARYLRSQLARLAGVPDDALSFWLKQGLIVDEDQAGGRGNRRRFTADEVKLAAFLREGRRAGLNVAALRSLVAIYRRAAAAFAPIASVPRVAEAISAAANDAHADEPWVTALEGQGHLSAGEAAELRAAQALISPEHVDDMWLMLNFAQAEGLWVAYRNDVGEWLLNTSSFEDELPAPSVLAFDCRRLFSIDWSKA